MKIKIYLPIALVFLLAGICAAQEPVAGVVVPTGYRLGPGDEIDVKVLGEPSFDFKTSVGADGTFQVLDRSVVAKCHTEKEVRADIVSVLSKYLKTPQLNVQIKSNSRPPATVYGEVRNPQGFILMRKVTLIEMLAQSGGPTEEAGPMVQIWRPQPPICTDDVEASNWKADTADTMDVPSRMYSLTSLRSGKEESNPTIYPGDVIFVSKAQPLYITGEVFKPQVISLKEGNMSLTQAIGFSGGVLPSAKTKNITIRRKKANSPDFEVLTANYDLIRTDKQKDIILQPFDIVEVDRTKDSMALTILKIAAGLGKAGASAAVTSGGYRVIN